MVSIICSMSRAGEKMKTFEIWTKDTVYSRWLVKAESEQAVRDGNCDWITKYDSHYEDHELTDIEEIKDEVNSQT